MIKVVKLSMKTNLDQYKTQTQESEKAQLKIMEIGENMIKNYDDIQAKIINCEQELENQNE